jgi:hypothetical protein
MGDSTLLVQEPMLNKFRNEETMGSFTNRCDFKKINHLKEQFITARSNIDIQL